MMMISCFPNVHEELPAPALPEPRREEAVPEQQRGAPDGDAVTAVDLEEDGIGPDRIGPG